MLLRTPSDGGVRRLVTVFGEDPNGLLGLGEGVLNCKDPRRLEFRTPDGVDAPEVVEDVEPTADMLSGSESVAPAGLSAGPDRGSPDEPEGGASVYPESAAPAVGLRVPELVGASFDGLAEVPAAERMATLRARIAEKCGQRGS